MKIRYMCTVHPHEPEFLTPPSRTPVCCGKPMKRVAETEEEPGDGQESQGTQASAASG